jgi:hypothetical protein
VNPSQTTGRCSYCGDRVPESELVWTGDEDGFACAECSEDEWFEATGVCKFGGPAPCIDDICHGLGGCMHYEGGA